MNTRCALSVGLVAGALLWTAAAPAQQAPSTDCTPHGKVGSAPMKVEGRITKLDTDAGRVTVQEADGKVHEFQLSKETVQNLKVGDRLAGKIRAC